MDLRSNVRLYITKTVGAVNIQKLNNIGKTNPGRKQDKSLSPEVAVRPIIYVPEDNTLRRVIRQGTPIQSVFPVLECYTHSTTVFQEWHALARL